MARQKNASELIHIWTNKSTVDEYNCNQERMDWFAGEGRFYPNRQEDAIVLRVSPVDDNLIETSRGTFIPFSVCTRLYRAFKAVTMPDDRAVGNYQLDRVSVDGLTIGCSFIEAKELERFAKVLGIAAYCGC